RLTRDAGDVAVDELVGDEIADDQDAAARKAVDEPEQPFPALGLAGKRMHATRDQHASVSSSPRPQDYPRWRRPPGPAAGRARAAARRASSYVCARGSTARRRRGQRRRRATCRRRRTTATD